MRRAVWGVVAATVLAAVALTASIGAATIPKVEFTDTKLKR